MSNQGGIEAWVTFAEDEETAIKALVLAKSLRRVKTDKKILIMVGPSVTDEMWKDLKVEFDYVVGMDSEALSECGLSFEQRARLSSFKMTWISSAFLLSPDVLFLENCDKIFESVFGGREEEEGGAVKVKREDLMELLNRRMIPVSPSQKTYADLKAGLAPSGSNLLPKNFTVQNELSEIFLSKYGLNIDLEKDSTAQWCVREEELKFVRFVGKHPLVFGGNHGSINGGSLEKSILELWKEIYSSVRTFEDPAQLRGIPSEKKENEPIAIVGMSCRFPGANNVAEFWSLLLNKGDGIVKVPKDRWLEEQCPNVDPDAMEVQAGFLKCPIDEFDGKFFGMNPMELSFTDPQQRFLLELSWEALEDAAINPQSLNGSSTGIFTGTWTKDYSNMMIENGGSVDDFFRSYMGNSFGATAGRMAHFFGTVGSNIATESGCSSSIVAVGMACESLRRKRTNLSLACGVNLLLHPFNYKKMGVFISPDGHCKTFDTKADGFGRAEGCGVLILKRLSDAVKDGDRIHAVIRGYGEAQEGPSKSLGTPTVAVEALAMRIALANAEVEPNQVQFVEAHGTGTAVGDPMEMEAIAEVYSKDRRDPLYVGSVKTNVGHTESCSGITGIIKTVLALKNETIPPHRALEELNPKIDLAKTPAIIPMEPIAWKRKKGQKRIAGVSSFGITGTDAHLILEEAPIQNKIWAKAKGKLPLNILALSAKSEDALNDLIKAYGKHLEQSPGGLTDVAFTANTGRAHFNGFRTAIVGKDSAEVVKKIGKDSYIKSVSGGKPKLCFLFTGQGSQYHKMGKTLYENAPEFRKHFDLCEEILTKTHGIELREVLWDENESALLHRTLYSQTSIFCIEYCLTKLWESWGIIPEAVLGHSLGEFAAACAAGILSLNDALKLVAERTKLIDSLPSGKMIVVKADLNQTKDLLKQLSIGRKDFVLDFAAINSPDQTALAGTTECVEEFKTFCENNEIKSHVLDATHAFHSRQMDSILPAYRKVAQGMKYGKPTCEFISGMEGKILNNVDAEYWVRHTRESVNFVGASKAVYSEGCRAFLEIGPQPILSAFIQTNLESEGETVKCIPSMRKKQDEWETILGALASLYVQEFDPNWNNFFKHIPTKKVSLPFYQFQRKKYWFEISKNGNGGTKFGGKELHPLIGSRLPNATKSSIFQVNLELEKEAWVKDHVVGKHVIFPGAGYLEMCLASGHASSLAGFEDFHLPYQPVVLQNLKIEAPLGIKDGDLCEMQTIVSSDDEANVEGESCWNKVSIYRHQGESSGAKKWVRHASASFSSILMDSKARLQENRDFETLKKEVNEEIDISKFYEQLTKVGLNFGPLFLSLKKLWKNDKEKLVQVQVPPQTEDKDRFLCHPVVIDAMIQAIMIRDEKDDQMKSLSVPVLIRRFLWFGKSDGVQSTNYIHVHQELDEESDSLGEMNATLYSEDGKKLALMEGVTLIQTTLESITNSLESQKIVLPRIYEEKWRSESKYGPLNLIEDAFLMNPENIKKMADCVELHTPIQESEMSDRKRLEEIIPLYGMKSFKELGWSPQIGDRIEIEEFIKRLGIILQNKLLTRRFFVMFCEDGFCSQIGPMEFVVIKEIPSMTDISIRIQFLSNSVQDMKLISDGLASGLVKLTGVLQGTDDILNILFGEGESDSLAEKIYRDTKEIIRVNELFSRTMEHVLCNWLKNKTNGKELRILEVGAGTGSATNLLLPILKKHNINYSYTFTDLSGMFFVRAESTFADYKEHMRYKVLDIEKDPKAQGFSPAYFDIVIAANVLHATKSLTKTLKNVRHLMKPQGFVFVVEHFKPIRMIDGGFGLLEGYWIFEDFDVRPYHALVSAKKWMDLFSKNGFQTSSSFKVVDQLAGVVLAQASNEMEEYEGISEEMVKNWLLFATEVDCPFTSSFESKLKASGRKVLKIKPGEYFKETISSSGGIEFTVRIESKEDLRNVMEQAKTCGEIEGFIYLWGLGANVELNKLTKGYLNLIQSIISSKFGQKQFPKLFVISEGAVCVGDQEPGSPLAGTLWGMSRSLRSEHPAMIVRCVDLDPSGSSAESKVSQAFTEMWKDDQDFMVVYRSGIRHICRLADTKIQLNPLVLPNSQRFSLILPSSKAISDLRFGTIGRPELKGNMIEIRVKAAALNFRDVFSVLKPISQFDNVNSVGADFAGVITAIGPDVKNRKIGDAVIGCNFEDQPLPSHVVSVEDAVVSLPNGMTFAEGSTLPAVFSTVHHCLIDIANLQKGETILIHTASGGVGLVAIQLAKDIGAKIIATAGSRKKRAYLRSLGLEHVFHSRDLSFEKEIKRVTRGKGVEMVLNSLTGPGFKEASLQVCAHNARFVEMSKLNIWTEEEVKVMRPDVKYTIADLTAVSEETMKYLFAKLNKYLIEGRVRPIQYVRFDCVEIREALTYLQKAKHIGKIVCVMPEIEMINGQLETRHEMFNDRSTYLITGGLGGIGLEAAKWMAKQGAKHIVLCGRSEPSEKAKETIDMLNNSDKNVVVIQSDVGKFEDCQKLLKRIKNEYPNLRGIMHAAGTLSDATFENQTWEKFEHTFNGKVNGALNLHQLTNEREGYLLEHFVMYSSMASILGSLGQSNHAAGNAFLDSLVQYRNSIGLPATSINWGQWGQVGVAAELEVPGLYPFTPLQAFTALDLILKSHKPQVSVMDCDWTVCKIMYSWTARGYLKEITMDGGSNSRGTQRLEISDEKFWKDIEAAPDRKEKEEVISNTLKQVLRSILRLDADEEIDSHQNFQDLGLDSLMMVEMKNILQRLVGNRVILTADQMTDANTVHLLTQKLSELIFAEDKITLTPEQLRAYILQESILPDEIQPSEGLAKLEEVSKVLLTQPKSLFASYLLENLCKRNQIQTVYCILPIENADKEQQKFEERLQARNLLEGIDMNKIKFIHGNIVEDKFGLESEAYNSLAEECDAVISTSLDKDSDDSPLIKKEGEEIKRILEFATDCKSKWVFHSSSLFPLGETSEGEGGQVLSESWPQTEDIESYHRMGYAGSKFVADRLFAQASERGIPCKVFRTPYLAGDTRSGYFELTKNHIFLRFLSYIEMGMMPTVAMPFSLLPVDFCAEIILKIFLESPSAPLGLYNLTNPHNYSYKDFIHVSEEYGHPIRAVELEDFFNEMGKKGVNNSIVEVMTHRYGDPLNYKEHGKFKNLTHLPEKEVFLSRVLQVFPNYLELNETPLVTLKRDLKFAHEVGLFKKLGI